MDSLLQCEGYDSLMGVTRLVASMATIKAEIAVVEAIMEFEQKKKRSKDEEGDAANAVAKGAKGSFLDMVQRQQKVADKPEQLHVPVASQDHFRVQLGLSWNDALPSGKVFSAMDGCAKLGLDADQVAAEWAKAKAAKELVKFGGGAFCGLVKVAGKEPMYIVNGFIMANEEKQTEQQKKGGAKPGARARFRFWDG